MPESEALARKCPQCYIAMKEFNYAYDSNVFLDRCEKCKGIWLDPNEIIDIAKHIQYNPDVDVVARELIRNSNSADEDAGKLAMIVGAVYVILRFLIFRR